MEMASGAMLGGVLLQTSSTLPQYILQILPISSFNLVILILCDKHGYIFKISAGQFSILIFWSTISPPKIQNNLGIMMSWPLLCNPSTPFGIKSGCEK
jgi:hypothetical protein